MASHAEHPAARVKIYLLLLHKFEINWLLKLIAEL